MKLFKLWPTGIIVGLLTLPSCSGAELNKTQNPYFHYRAEMTFQLGDKTYRGLAVTKVMPGESVDVIITSPITLNRVEISTCSRHEVIRNTASGWFDKVKNTMTYRYSPTGKELEGNCPLFIQAFNDSVQKSWGMIAFRTDQTLAGHIDCNGKPWDYAGISVCQTKAGLEQELTFAKPVEFEPDAGCKITASADKKKFELRNVGVGWCKAVFTDGKDFHELILLGYDQVIVY